MECGTAWYLIPEWWAVALTLVGMTGGGTAWLMQRRFEARAALPIIRRSWTEGEKGCTCHIELENRLNEDLYVTCARARGTLVECQYTYAPSTGSTVLTGEVEHRGVMTLSESAKPNSQLRFTISLQDKSERARRSLKIQVSSSNSTLRKRWINLS